MNIKNGFLFLSLCFFSSLVLSETPSSLDKRIKKFGLNKSELTYLISEVRKDKLKDIYKFQENKPFIPASLIKIPVLNALGEIYPPSQNFETQFVSQASLSDGLLKGDLILKGGGDSSFTSESLWKLVNNLTRSGVKKIEGDLIIDGSLYKKDKLPITHRSYHARTSAASFNWNSVAFYIRPGKTLGEKAFVFANPESSYIKVINKVKTGKRNKIVVKRRKASLSEESFEISGQISQNKDEIPKYANVKNPEMWLGANAKSFLNQRGIEVLGKIKTGRCQGKCKVLAKWKSRPISFHYYNMMKYSSNFVTRMLVSHISILKGKQKGDLRFGTKKVAQILKTKGLKNFHLDEVSGLSRKNKFTSKEIRTSLIMTNQSFFSSEALSAYPIAGSRGTLEKRFKNLDSHLLVRAKTGRLLGVIGLAGFAKNKKTKKDYVFVFLFNGSGNKGEEATQFFDELLIDTIK